MCARSTKYSIRTLVTLKTGSKATQKQLFRHVFFQESRRDSPFCPQSMPTHGAQPATTVGHTPLPSCGVSAPRGVGTPGLYVTGQDYNPVQHGPLRTESTPRDPGVPRNARTRSPNPLVWVPNGCGIAVGDWDEFSRLFLANGLAGVGISQKSPPPARSHGSMQPTQGAPFGRNGRLRPPSNPMEG